IEQMSVISSSAGDLLDSPASAILDLDRCVSACLRGSDFPATNFGAPLAASLIPWIDKPMDNGQTREEWKGYAETNKILDTATPIPIDGLCVRVGAMRCHSQGLTIKLKKDLPLDEIIAITGEANQWVKVIPNSREETIQELTPAKVSGTLAIPIGRIRKMNLGSKYLAAFTCGDQLLWGAAEPIRRILSIILEHDMK
ncbi:MAG: aspartate-semialdehyde dehydrogenase, partial [Pseudomonadota bacterium]